MKGVFRGGILVRGEEGRGGEGRGLGGEDGWGLGGGERGEMGL